MARNRKKAGGNGPRRSPSPNPPTGKSTGTDLAPSTNDTKPETPSSPPIPRGSAPRPIQEEVPYCPNFSIAMRCLIVPRLFAAILLPVMDCDEVFNYWEPLHYAQYGSGLETWEYTPEYGLRSWLYIFLHYPLAAVIALLGKRKHQTFIIMRILLAFMATAADARLYRSVVENVNPRIGRYLLIALFCSAGIMQASSALLPSSFAGMCVSLAASFFFRGPANTSRDGYVWKGVMCLVVAAVVGWPFAAAIGIPYALAELALPQLRGEAQPGWRFSRLRRLILAGMISLPIVGLSIGVDSWAYQKLIFVPYNLVRYNVLGANAESGPDIFGTESWSFYLVNLTLNFNLLTALALLAPVLVTFAYRYTTSRAPFVHGLFWDIGIKTTPVLLWLAIFSLQPHKEERFMTPVYPLIAFNAAVSVFMLRDIGEVWLSSLIFAPSRETRLLGLRALTYGMFVLTFVLSALRLWATGEHYGASMTVWQSLDEGKRSVEPGTVCVGKEWYRYPSSYFLPANMRLRFIQSEFDGLLPGTFIEVPKGTSPARQGRFAETFHRPGFSASRGDYNGRNAWAADKVVDVETCDYLVDLDFPARYTEGQAPSLLEPRYVRDTEKWEKIRCERFLDVEKTPAMLRRLWLGEDDRRVWGDYCLLKAKRE